MKFLYTTALATLFLIGNVQATAREQKQETQQQLVSTIHELTSHLKEVGVDIKTLGIESATWTGDAYKTFKEEKLRKLRIILEDSLEKTRKTFITNIKMLKRQAKTLGVNIKALGIKGKKTYEQLSARELRKIKETLQEAIDKVKAQKKEKFMR